MKFKSFCYAIVSALAMIACSEEQEAPVIRAVAVDISKDAGQYSLNYLIENPTKGSLSAEITDADWIYDLSIEDQAVKFSAEQNVDIPRSATLTLSYPGAESISVKINQASVFEGAFKISVDDITPYGCTVTYEPVEYDGNYLFFVMSKAGVMKYLLEPDGLDALYEGDLEWIQERASLNGLSLEEFLPRVPSIYTTNGKTTTMKYSDLDYNTEYIAYCYGMGLDGTRLTDYVMAEFSTAIVESSDITFTAEVKEITKNSAEIYLTPSNDEDYYFWTYISEMEYSQMDLESIMTNMVANIKEEVENWGMSITQYIDRGNSVDIPTDLWSGTKYYIVAWGMDFGGTPTTLPMDVASFTTLSEDITDDCQFDVTVTDVLPMDMKIKVVPSKSTTRYYVAPIDESKCVGYNDRQMAQRVVNMEAARIEQNYYTSKENSWEGITHIGTNEFWGYDDLYWTFLPEHNYHIYVFGIDSEGNISTEVKRIDQKTLPIERSNMTIDIKCTNNTWNYGYFEFTPSVKNEYYLPFLMDTQYAELYKKADGTYDEAMLMEAISEYYEDEIVYYMKKGKSKMSFYWKSDVDYTVLVCGYGGTNTTQFFEYKVHAPAIPFEKGKGEVEGEYVLIDGTELANKFPDAWDHSDVDGDCIMVTKYKPNEDALHWYAGVWLPADYYEYGVDHLMALIRNTSVPSNCYDETQKVLRPWYNNPWAWCYVAEDVDENFGKWHYEEFTPRVSDTVEPFDFWTKNDEEEESYTAYKLSNNGSVTKLSSNTKSSDSHDSMMVVDGKKLLEKNTHSVKENREL